MFNGELKVLRPYEAFWMFREPRPAKQFVVDRIRNWNVYSHGLRMNEVIFSNGEPTHRREILFYLPREEGQMVEFLAELSMIGYGVYSITTDSLAGVFFERNANHQTSIDADLIQTFMDYSKKVSTTDFNSPDVMGVR